MRKSVQVLSGWAAIFGTPDPTSKCPASRSQRGIGSMLALCAAVLLTATPQTLSGQTPGIGQFEGKRIAGIEYSPAQNLDPADLATAQPLKVGEPLRASDVADAIDGLWATGQFVDIVVEAENSPNGAVIRFVTRPQWFVGGLGIGGKISSPPNNGEIASNANLPLGGPFQDQDIARAVASMTRLFNADGLYEAQIAPEVERDSQTQQVFVTVRIKAGHRAKYTNPVVEGNSTLSEDTILRATGWRIPVIHLWRRVSESRTRNGVRGLLGKFQDEKRLLAQVNLQKLDYDPEARRVQPHLQVEPGPKVEVKSVDASVSQRTFKKYVPVFQERTVDNDLLVEGKRNLQDYFQGQGYYDVNVEFRTQPPQDDLETIEYVISTGQRFKVVRVSVVGNKYFGVDTIRERMLIAPASFTVRHGRYSDAFVRRDTASIEDIYKANGFRQVKVAIAAQRDYRGKQGEVAVTLTVDEGPQWLVSNLTVNGIEKMKRDEITSLLTSVAGQPFAEVNLASDRNAVLTYYYEHGFAAATFQAQWRRSGLPNRADVVYTISEGNEQFVRKVITSGLANTRQSVIDKAITMKPGDPLSPIAEAEIQRSFYNMGIFARVDTAIQNPDGDIAHKYVLYNFDEASRYDLSIGLGAQIAQIGQPSVYSLGSPGGSTGFSPEVSADLSRLNFFGLGHTLTLHGEYSSINQLASLSYIQPRFMGDPDRTLTYSLLYNEEFDIRTFASLREEASVQVSQKLSKSLTGLLGVAYRRVSVSQVVIPSLLIPLFLQPVRIGIVTANLSQDKRDNSANPHHGVYNTADIGIAGKFLGSQRSFVRALFRNATYYSLTKNLILARQTQFGLIIPFAAPPGISAEQSVPLPERFFAGGADSMRGFAYDEAGPRDIGAPLVPGGPSSAPTGFPLGGNAIFMNNVELRFPLIGSNIQGVLFHDMGNVYDKLSDISLRFTQKNVQDFNYAVQAAGFGVRYKTPVGPIRLDLAYSINPPAYEGFGGTPEQLLQCNPNNPNPASYCTPSHQQLSHFQFFFSIGQTF